jgi:hypothetical protein
VPAVATSDEPEAPSLEKIEELRGQRRERGEPDFTDPGRTVMLLDRVFMRETSDSTMTTWDAVFELGETDAEEHLTILREFPDVIEVLTATFTTWENGEPKVEQAVIVRSDEAGGTTSVTFALPRLSWPSVIAVRLTVRREGSMGWLEHSIQRDVPVLESGFHIRGEDESPPQILTRRMNPTREDSGTTPGGGFFHELVFEAVPPIEWKPHLPPDEVYAPVVLLYRHGFEGALSDYGSNSLEGERGWNLVAAKALLFMTGVTSERIDLRAAAQQIIKGAKSALEREQLLFRYVRDELLLVADVEKLRRHEEDWSLSRVVESRAATEFEKALLLLTLLRALESEADLVWTASEREGVFELETPSFYQFSEALVRVNDVRGARWYDPGCDVCAPGEIRGNLQGRRGFAFLPTAEYDLGTAARSSFDINSFMMRLGSKPLSRWIELPPDKNSEPRCTEELSFEWHDDEISVELRGRGDIESRRVYRHAGSAEAAIGLVLAEQFADVEPASVQPISEPSGESMFLRARLTGLRLPPPAGAMWIIPVTGLFRDCPFGIWQGDRAEPFLLPATRRTVVRHTIPLPEQWPAVIVPSDREHSVGPISYAMRFSEEGGRLSIERVVQTRFALADRVDHKLALARAMETICELDREAIVLQQTSGAEAARE